MAVTTRNTVFTNVAAGKGFTNNYAGIGPGSPTTAAAAASGFHTVQLYFNNVGTTLPGTLVDFPLPPSPGGPLLGMYGQFGSVTGAAVYLVRLYKFGTLDLSA